MQGLLLLDKPENITSYGAVARVKRLTGEKHVGHTGTLDPMATGVLPVLLGRATALSAYLLDADKRYLAGVRLGVTTDTADSTGTVTSESPVTVTGDELAAVLSAFTGRQLQTPPMFSALKKNGVPLYRLARAGQTFTLPPREIEIYSLTQTAPLDENGCFSIDVRVSKGTYIRSLCRDIGEKLGCGAVMTSLRRVETSGFSLGECVPLDTLTCKNVFSFLQSGEIAVAGLPAAEVTEKQAVRFCNGGQLDFERLHLPETPADGMLFRVRCGENFLGLGAADCAANQLAVRCVINDIRTSVQGRE